MMVRKWNGQIIWVILKTIAKWNGWSDGGKGLQLVTCLRGKAERVLNEIPSGQREDFATPSEFLSRRFNPPNWENAFRFELQQHKMLAQESLMELLRGSLAIDAESLSKLPILSHRPDCD